MSTLHSETTRRFSALSQLPSARSVRRLSRVVAVVALVCSIAGPATGVLHAIHLAQAGADHDDEQCSFCQQLISTSKYVPDPPAEVSAVVDLCWFAADALPAECPPQFVPLSVLPRGPPAPFVL